MFKKIIQKIKSRKKNNTNIFIGTSVGDSIITDIKTEGYASVCFGKDVKATGSLTQFVFKK